MLTLSWTRSTTPTRHVSPPTICKRVQEVRGQLEGPAPLGFCLRMSFERSVGSMMVWEVWVGGADGTLMAGGCLACITWIRSAVQGRRSSWVEALKHADVPPRAARSTALNSLVFQWSISEGSIWRCDEGSRKGGFPMVNL